MCVFRDLRADEIDCRVSTCSEKGVSLLLYKDARVDMNILDEVFGVTGWQRSHELIGDRLYCTVSVYDDKKGMWISKQDVGTESYTEKEKGQASDSFKRACFNLGIGRELYTAPFIWISAGDCNLKNNNGKWTTYDRFEVNDIEIENKKIVKLAIANCKTGEVVFSYGYGAAKKATKKAEKAVICPKCGKPVQPVVRPNGSTASPTEVLKGCGDMCYNCYQATKS